MQVGNFEHTFNTWKKSEQKRDSHHCSSGTGDGWLDRCCWGHCSCRREDHSVKHAHGYSVSPQHSVWERGKRIGVWWLWGEVSLEALGCVWQRKEKERKENERKEIERKKIELIFYFHNMFGWKKNEKKENRTRIIFSCLFIWKTEKKEKDNDTK